MPDKYIIDREVLDKVVNYLAAKPYVEVVGILNEIQNSVMKNNQPAPEQIEKT